MEYTNIRKRQVDNVGKGNCSAEDWWMLMMVMMQRLYNALSLPSQFSLVSTTFMATHSFQSTYKHFLRLGFLDHHTPQLVFPLPTVFISKHLLGFLATIFLIYSFRFIPFHHAPHLLLSTHFTTLARFSWLWHTVFASSNSFHKTC